MRNFLPYDGTWSQREHRLLHFAEAVPAGPQLSEYAQRLKAIRERRNQVQTAAAQAGANTIEPAAVERRTVDAKSASERNAFAKDKFERRGGLLATPETIAVIDKAMVVREEFTNIYGPQRIEFRMEGPELRVCNADEVFVEWAGKDVIKKMNDFAKKCKASGSQEEWDTNKRNMDECMTVLRGLDRYLVDLNAMRSLNAQINSNPRSVLNWPERLMKDNPTLYANAVMKAAVHDRSILTQVEKNFALEDYVDAAAATFGTNDADPEGKKLPLFSRKATWEKLLEFHPQLILRLHTTRKNGKSELQQLKEAMSAKVDGDKTEFDVLMLDLAKRDAKFFMILHDIGVIDEVRLVTEALEKNDPLLLKNLTFSMFEKKSYALLTAICDREPIDAYRLAKYLATSPESADNREQMVGQILLRKPSAALYLLEDSPLGGIDIKELLSRLNDGGLLQKTLERQKDVALYWADPEKIDEIYVLQDRLQHYVDVLKFVEENKSATAVENESYRLMKEDLLQRGLDIAKPETIKTLKVTELRAILGILELGVDEGQGLVTYENITEEKILKDKTTGADQAMALLTAMRMLRMKELLYETFAKKLNEIVKDEAFTPKLDDVLQLLGPLYAELHRPGLKEDAKNALLPAFQHLHDVLRIKALDSIYDENKKNGKRLSGPPRPDGAMAPAAETKKEPASSSDTKKEGWPPEKAVKKRISATPGVVLAVPKASGVENRPARHERLVPNAKDAADVKSWAESIKEAPKGELQPLLLEYMEALKKAFLIPKDAESEVVTLTLCKAEWELGMTTVSGHTYPILRKKDDPDVLIMLQEGVVLDKANLEYSAQLALQYSESEKKDAAKISRFDLPKKETAYIEMADFNDVNMRGLAVDSANFPKLLAQKYNMYRSANYRIDGRRGSALAALRSQIAEQHNNGVKSFYINVYAHGFEGGFVINGSLIHPDQILDIMKQYSDCEFVLNSISCHGAGFEKAMMNFADSASASAGRITVFHHSKSYVPNIMKKGSEKKEAPNPGGPDLLQKGENSKYDTVYMRALARELNKAGVTYGQAHVIADREAKRAQFTDAGAQTSQPGKKSKLTADNSPDRFKNAA